MCPDLFARSPSRYTKITFLHHTLHLTVIGRLRRVSDYVPPIPIESVPYSLSLKVVGAILVVSLKPVSVEANPVPAN